MHFNAICTLLLGGYVILTTAYPSFRNKIPNGDTVPNPCRPNISDTYWAGVGHEQISGRGARNPFGRDFEKHGKTWTEALCRLDSDGDGKSNGEELGDPDCTWREGQNPKLANAVSHPGICDTHTKSVTKEYCASKNSWLKCQPFKCPAFDKPGVQSLDLKFSETSIPGEKDSYYCYGVKLPADKSYHIIGFQPNIVNNDFVHDIIVYGCDDKPDGDRTLQGYQQLQKCFAGLTDCRTPIGAWSSETDGQCFSEDFGLAMGPGGYRYAVVQIHWHNPEEKTGRKDSSGMKLYYTNQLRPHTGQVLRVGQRYINLAHGKKQVVVEGKCTGSCTNLMVNRTTRIASAFLRMNKLGVSGGIDLYSGRSRKTSLLIDQQYDINQPELINFIDPVRFNAGEEVKITCRYNTESQVLPVAYGEEVDKEMCTGFITVYPATSNLSICSQWRDLTVCSLNAELSYPSCDKTTFFRLMPLIDQHCDKSCDGLCAVMIRGFTHTGCYKGILADFIDEFYVNNPANRRVKTTLLPLIKTCLQKVNSAGRSVPMLFINFSFITVMQSVLLMWVTLTVASG